jgi:glycosyltransferase involved in cell wall biosynthesis
MTKISLCMVVRNEARRLPLALESAKGLYDELVIVDTGSSDDTQKTAAQHRARIIHADPALDDMSAWLNLGLDATTGDWCVRLDADHAIDKALALREFLLGLPDEVGGCHLIQNNIEEGNVTLAWSQLLAFRRGAYRYKYREHEIPLPVAATKETICNNVTIYHRPRQSEGKSDTQLRRLRLSVDEHPGDAHPRYFLARLHTARGEHEEAIKQFTEFLQLAGPDTDVCEAFGFLALSHAALGDIGQAGACLHNAMLRQPHRRYWWVRLGELYCQTGAHNIALAYLRGATELLPSGEQHARPVYTTSHLYDLIQVCQAALYQGANNG